MTQQDSAPSTGDSSEVSYIHLPHNILEFTRDVIFRSEIRRQQRDQLDARRNGGKTPDDGAKARAAESLKSRAFMTTRSGPLRGGGVVPPQ